MKQHRPISTAYIDALIAQTKTIGDHFSFSMGLVFETFLHIIKSDSVAQFDNFQSMSDKIYLQELKGQLEDFRGNANHKYKKLHYTYLISRITDRLLELETGSSLSSEEKLKHQLQQGDVGLISYASHGSSWNDLLNQGANNLLRLFSHSIFAHVGIIGKKVENSFEWIHSTLHNDGGRTGVKILNLHHYMSAIKPCELCILRIKGEKLSSDVIKAAHDFESKKIGYNTRSAIGDITGFNTFRKQKDFNCGELVYHCIKSIVPRIRISKKALPSSYLGSKYLEQIYITTISSNE